MRIQPLCHSSAIKLFSLYSFLYTLFWAVCFNHFATPPIVLILIKKNSRASKIFFLRYTSKHEYLKNYYYVAWRTRHFWSSYLEFSSPLWKETCSLDDHTSCIVYQYFYDVFLSRWKSVRKLVYDDATPGFLLGYYHAHDVRVFGTFYVGSLCISCS